MKKSGGQKGFTLIELLLVVVIIGVMLAVIVPRAWRANVDSKYGLVRQNCTELASFASLWTEEMIAAQDLTGAQPQPGMNVYFGSLTTAASAGATAGTWIGGTATNWTANIASSLTGRTIGAAPAAAPEAPVSKFIPPERLPRNPFSGVSVFQDLPTGNAIPGAIAAGNASDNAFKYYALVFQGTDSTSATVTDAVAFHAGMTANSLAGLRNGIFMARVGS